MAPPQQPFEDRLQWRPPQASGGRQRERGRGGLFPVPHRTWRTRRGSTVTVGGCCLPLPIGCLASVALAVAGATAAAHRSRH